MSTDQPTTKPSRKGRPSGAKNRDYDVVEAELTKCRKCGSTDRTKYLGKPTELRQANTDVTIVITWKKCQCTNCGQWRRDKYIHKEVPIPEQFPGADQN